MHAKPLRILVVDDSVLYRKVVRAVVAAIPGIEVVGTAVNGRDALDKITSLSPDLITLDMEMPLLDGLGVLRELQRRGLAVKTVMISAFTAEGAQATSQALRLGAFDFVLKPAGTSLEQSQRQLRDDLVPIIEACRNSLHTGQVFPASKGPVAAASEEGLHERMQAVVNSCHGRRAIVGIGISTGGPAALTRMLPQLPADFPCPIVIVQHMPPMFTKSLADDLNRLCRLEVREASAGVAIVPGQIWLAPGGSQMRVAKQADKTVVEITEDPPERNCKPAVDYLFRSLALHFGRQTVAAVMTGMGDDGTIGSQMLKERGALILAQDEASCVVYGMPRAVAEAGVVDRVVPLDQMASQLAQAVGLPAGSRQGAAV